MRERANSEIYKKYEYHYLVFIINITLEVEQIAFLDDGRAFEYSKAYHRGDKQVFRVVSIR